MMKKFNSPIYTEGKFGKGFREIVDTDNEFLYSYGVYPTKIKREDLPEDYIKIHSRSIWYMHGYVKTSNVVDVDYQALKINHLFKDDYLYISYKNKLSYSDDGYGFIKINSYDIRICGNSIIPVLLEIEKHSNIDTSKVREKIIDKFNWWKEKYPEDYNRFFKNNEDIFENYK